ASLSGVAESAAVRSKPSTTMGGTPASPAPSPPAAALASAPGPVHPAAAASSMTAPASSAARRRTPPCVLPLCRRLPCLMPSTPLCPPSRWLSRFPVHIRSQSLQSPSSPGRRRTTGAGHMLPVAHPQAVVDAIDALRGLARRAGVAPAPRELQLERG